MTKILKLPKLITFYFLEKLFSKLSNIFDKLSQYFSLCPKCLQNRYTGKSCTNNNQNND